VTQQKRLPASAKIWLKLGMQNSQLYPCDLSAAQADVLEPLMPKPARRGRKPTPWRCVLNAIFYVLRSGCAWRYLPKHYPPWQTVYGWYRRWQQRGVWQQIHDELRARVRVQAGKARQPTAGIVDSQSVKVADQSGERGYDAGKKVSGRKRHVLVDTLGLVLLVCVTAANVQDRDGARALLARLAGRFSRLVLIWADGGYAGRLVGWLWGLQRRRKVRLEIVPRLGGNRFVVLPKRWIVERTFGWLLKWRRLRCDYEQRFDHSEALIYIAMIGLMTRRLARKK
jgi:putative transposase